MAARREQRHGGEVSTVHAQSPRQCECCAELGRRAVCRGACVSPLQLDYCVTVTPARRRSKESQSGGQRNVRSRPWSGGGCRQAGLFAKLSARARSITLG